MHTGGRVAKRLAWYWQVEVANAVVVPALMIGYAVVVGDGLHWTSIVALLPVIGLLLIGGLYWRGKLHEIRGDRRALDKALALADRAQRPMLVLTVYALVRAVGDSIAPFPGHSDTDRWIVLIASLLALAEYVNYYHRQLQHFDNWPDFKRLITGRGLRPAKMAVDLAAWRAAQRSGSEA